MINERSSFGSVSFMDKLYICGGKGYTESAPLNSCEMYDSITDKWIQIAPMQEKRVYMELLKYNDKLYAIGGENLNTFEVYDYKSNSWSHTTLLPTKMWDFGATVIKEV
ncbi:kelch-like protein 7 [Oppia nitens]|uniref:kelch-like protein 7 n=1 Tax=Oppia nitens TaxID=1686743 RepID=UPI0023DBCA33|nr:kelch-like protein 7 [Oppia nitens]